MDFDLRWNMRPEAFRGKGPLRFYVYEWIWRNEARYVGRGVGIRYQMFYTSRKYGGPERHNFVRENKHELTCRYAVTNVALDAAKEAEALLIGHWRLKKDGGTLFNDQVPRLPVLNDLGDDRSKLAEFNVPALVPSPDKCLIYAEFYDLWLGDKPDWNEDDIVEFTGAPTCWSRLHRGQPSNGMRLDREVLRPCLPATVGEIVSFAADFDFQPNEICAKRGHLSWGRDKGYLK